MKMIFVVTLFLCPWGVGGKWEVGKTSNRNRKMFEWVNWTRRCDKRKIRKRIICWESRIRLISISRNSRNKTDITAAKVLVVTPAVTAADVTIVCCCEGSIAYNVIMYSLSIYLSINLSIYLSISVLLLIYHFIACVIISAREFSFLG